MKKPPDQVSHRQSPLEDKNVTKESQEIIPDQEEDEKNTVVIEDDD